MKYKKLKIEKNLINKKLSIEKNNKSEKNGIFYLLMCGAVIIFSIFLFACQKESTEDFPSVSTNRTIVVYLGVDNNFRSEAAQKIELLKNNWDKSFDGNLFVYADTGNESNLIHIYFDKEHGNQAEIIESYTNENSANSSTLTNVLNTVKNLRPANSYGLVVLSHGTGWLPADMSAPSISLKSVIIDTTTEDTYNYMELSDFANAIPYKLDFLIFDACFMASVEVCYELKEKADYIVASPAEVMVPGFVYTSMMKHLFKKQPDLIAVANDFFQYYNKQSDYNRSATVSVTKTSDLDALLAIFKQSITEKHSLYYSENVVDDVQHFGYGIQKIFFDLGDFIQKIAPENSQQIEYALGQSVIFKAHTPSYYSAGTRSLNSIYEFSGLSVYIPQEKYPIANQEYKKLKWAKDGEFFP